MRERLNTLRSSFNWLQILIGVSALFIGLLLYLVDRSPDRTYFIYKTNIDISLYNTFPNLIGPISGSLPAFIHVFSFILITAGVVSCRKTGYLIICASWLILDCSFELGQKYNALISAIIPDWFAGIPVLENSNSYFLKGTFDPADMAAIIGGTMAAYVILITTSRGISS